MDLTQTACFVILVLCSVWTFSSAAPEPAAKPDNDGAAPLLSLMSNLNSNDARVRSALSMIPLDALATVAHALGKKSKIPKKPHAKKNKSHSKKDKSKAANRSKTVITNATNVTSMNSTVTNATAQNATIPWQCTGLVKAYTNGELTMLDYRRELHRCKLKDKLERLTGEERQAYMKKHHINPTSYMYTENPGSQLDEAQNIFDGWRKRSFGERKNKSTVEAPNAIKSFMQLQ